MRRKMFPSVFNAIISKNLDRISLEFICKSRLFNEIIILKIEGDKFIPLYDYSLRDSSIDEIKIDEFENIAKIGEKLENGYWKYIDAAEGSSFDMVGKVDKNILICVNNTESSIKELEQRFQSWTFEEVKPVIEQAISNIKKLLKGEV